MGYCIELEEIKGLTFYEEDCINIISDIKEWIKNQDHVMWIDKPYIMRVTNIEELFEELRYGLEWVEHNKSYRITEFYGEKLGEETKIFEVLAKYLKDGYIEFLGEDGDRLKLNIKNHKLIEEWI